MIGIINYGLGNLSSVNNAFKKVSDDVEIFDDPNLIKKYSKLVLPGVGSFKAGMKLLIEKKWNDRIENFVKSGNYLLGICLGMQLLFKNGFEDGQTDGLNLIEGSVTEMKIDKKLKLPHVGWNSLIFKKEHQFFNNINRRTDYYFVHSYSCNPINKDLILAEFDYGNNFTATVGKDNLIGTQFHPEKSLPSGLQLIKNFINLKD